MEEDRFGRRNVWEKAGSEVYKVGKRQGREEGCSGEGKVKGVLEKDWFGRRRGSGECRFG